MMGKSTKHEARNPKQIQNVLNFENSNLDINSDFDIRYSDFEFTPEE